VIHDLLVVTLRGLAEKLDPAIPSILLAHLSLDQAKAGAEATYMMGRDICLSTADIPENIDHCFFGHVHKPQIVTRSQASALRAEADELAWVIGSIESVDFGEEGEEKRWLLLDTDAGTVHSIPTGAREYKTYHVDADDLPTQDDWCTWLRDFGQVVRVKVAMRRGQECDLSAVKREPLLSGAFSVQIVREYEEEIRVSEAESGRVETHEDVLRGYCASKGIPGERASALVAAGVSALAEAKGD
jgi:predicted phosphohydrolase